MTESEKPAEPSTKRPEFRLRPTIQQILESPAEGQELEICAWVRSRRDSKNVSFLNINDGSSVSGMQVVIEQNCREACGNSFGRLLNGASVRVSGRLVASEGAGQSAELQAAQVELLGAAEAYPLQKKRHSFEFLREQCHLRSRSNSIGAVMRMRSRLSMLVHEFFQQHGFCYLHSPIITLSDAEGAGEMFQLESMSYQNKAANRHFFGREAYLTVSGQLEAEAYAHSHGRVYTFGPTFRAEESDTARHLAEFWMIEPEVAFMELEGLMDFAEACIRYLIGRTLEQCADELALLDKWIEPGLIASLETVADSAAFVRMSYLEAIERLQNAEQNGKKFAYPPTWESGLQTEHERWLTEEYCGRPVIVYDYPKEGKAFYMKQNEDGRTVRGMDLLVPRLGEIIGGSQREDDAERLQARMQQDGIDLEHYRWYLDLRRFGAVPHSGFGLGFERLLQYVSGMKNIRDVIPFPRVLGRAF